MTFDQWMKKRSPGYLPSDDGEILRSLRECWLAAQKAERERYLPTLKTAAKNLQTVARVPNAEYFSDLHNAAVEAIRKFGDE